MAEQDGFRGGGRPLAKGNSAPEGATLRVVAEVASRAAIESDLRRAARAIRLEPEDEVEEPTDVREAP